MMPRSTFPFADIYAERNEHELVISVKARNKNQKNGKLNAFYNLGKNLDAKAAAAAEKYQATPYWMAIQLTNERILFTWGLWKSLMVMRFHYANVKMEQLEVPGKRSKDIADFEYFGNK